MDVFASLLQGFETAITPINLLWCLIGVSLGTAIGILPEGVWTGAVVLGSLASIALLAMFFHPWLVVGFAIDAALIWLAIAWRWTPSMLVG